MQEEEFKWTYKLGSDEYIPDPQLGQLGGIGLPSPGDPDQTQTASVPRDIVFTVRGRKDNAAFQEAITIE